MGAKKAIMIKNMMGIRELQDVCKYQGLLYGLNPTFIIWLLFKDCLSVISWLLKTYI